MKIDDIDDFLDYFGSIRGRTKRVAAVIPPDLFDWAPKPGAFTFADTIRHLAATERWMFAETVSGRPSAYPGCGRELADGAEGVMRYLDTMHEQALALFSLLTPEQLARKCMTPGGVEITTWKWLRAMTEHEIHHRGQIYMMLGLNGIATPPLYGLTSEQVKERSVQLS
jgi:uncharacterized damage-inducible protein DinB